MATTIAAPNLGNLSNPLFLQKAEWVPVSANEDGSQKDTVNLATCVDAILHDILRKYFAEINEVFACRKTDIPLFACIDTSGSKWREGDDAARVLTLAALGALSVPSPQLLIAGNGTGEDTGTSGAGRGVVHGPSGDANCAFVVASAPGSQHESGGPVVPVVWALRNHASRWYRVAPSPIGLQAGKIIMSAVIRIPHWHQANEDYVIASWANVTNEVKDGADRGWRWGLGAGLLAHAHPNDLTMFFEWVDSGDVVRRIAAVANPGESRSFGLLPGGEYTVGISINMAATTEARFFVNGIDIGYMGFAGATDPAFHGDMSLIIGSDQAGKGYIGSIRNFYMRTEGLGYSLTNDTDTLAAIYKIGAGF